MVNVYVDLIKKNLWSIDSVSKIWRDAVIEECEKQGIEIK